MEENAFRYLHALFFLHYKKIFYITNFYSGWPGISISIWNVCLELKILALTWQITFIKHLFFIEIRKQIINLLPNKSASSGRQNNYWLRASLITHHLLNRLLKPNFEFMRNKSIIDLVLIVFLGYFRWLNFVTQIENHKNLA